MQQKDRLAGTQVYRCALGHVPDTKGDTGGTASSPAAGGRGSIVGCVTRNPREVCINPMLDALNGG
jgi:hypothetical protein